MASCPTMEAQIPVGLLVDAAAVREPLSPARAPFPQAIAEEEAAATTEIDFATDSRTQQDPRATILALYDEYRPRLFRYICSMRLGRDGAEEVIQETFMRLTTALIKDIEIENVQGWIVRVAHNLAIDMLKKNNGLLSGEEVSLAITNRPDPALNPEEVYAEKESTRRMKAALSTLKPQHRECFRLRALGLRYKAIGAALGISEQRAAFVVKQAAIRLAALCG